MAVLLCARRRDVPYLPNDAPTIWPIGHYPPDLHEYVFGHGRPQCQL
jgi:hypothetical protein